MPEMTRKSRTVLVTGSIMLVVLTGFGFKGYILGDRKGQEDRNGDARMAEAINRFSLAMFLKMNSVDSNLILSPCSVFTALAIAHEGAVGPTRQEMGKILNISEPDLNFHEGVGELSRQIVNSVATTGGELNLANGLWVRKIPQSSISQQFKESIQTNYEAEIREIDVQQSPESVSRDINDWVKTKTRGKIKELISGGEVNTATLMMLVNAIYFKCPWAIQFHPKSTHHEDFSLLDGSRVRAPMMNTSGNDYKYMESRDLQILAMPYHGSAVSMIVLLPRKFGGLGQLEKSLTLESLTAWLDRLAPNPEGVEVFLPKFSLRSRFGLVPALKSMGMAAAFDSHQADFSRLFESPVKGASVSEVVHESWIEVNEKGTEAAAATGMSVWFGPGNKPGPKTFRADHPFIFIIRHNLTGCILFMGRVTNPLASGASASQR